MAYDYYKLDENRNTVPVDSVEYSFLGSEDRRVGYSSYGDVSISTVFLALNHQWGDGPPLLFETMIFGGPHNEYQTRCSTWAQAEEMHTSACLLVQAAQLEEEKIMLLGEEIKFRPTRDITKPPKRKLGT